MPNYSRSMKKLFYAGVVLLVLFEAANVYFIMPMPFSQRMRTIDFAYALYSWRWAFRAVFGAMVLAGAPLALRGAGKTLTFRPLSPSVPPAVALVVAAAAVYALNFEMAADHIF